MTNIEQKALALVNGVKTERGRNSYSHYTRLNRALDDGHEALCRAIEQHEATKQEVERLNGLITATADHWLTLQVKHPIQWEGAINSAMAAACAEIEKHEAFRQEVSDAVENTRFMVETHCDTEALALVSNRLNRFIIIAKPDPLADVAKMMGYFNTAADAWADDFRAALDALGLEIREKDDD